MSRLRSGRTGTCVLAAFLAAWAWTGRTGRADTFGAALEWAWTGPTAGDPAPDYAQVDATPIVVSLNDDNGDGRVDQRDVPDIVFPATSSLVGSCLSDGVLRAISGADGTPLFGIFAPAYRVNECSPVAAGDIDGDGLPEIIAFQGTATGSVNRLIAFENDGTFKWFSHPLPPANRPGWGAGPSIADLNHDRRPEIILGATVFDGEGQLVFSRLCEGNPGTFSTAANLDLVGDAEIVCGFTAYRSNGDLFWDARPAGAGPGTAAVADFDGDGRTEVVHADQAHLRVFDGTSGAVLFETASSSCTWTENPVVADVDGDGSAEIVAPRNEACGPRVPSRGIYVFGGEPAWVGAPRVWNQHAYHVTNVAEDGTIPVEEPNNWQVPGLNNFRVNAYPEVTQRPVGDDARGHAGLVHTAGDRP